MKFQVTAPMSAASTTNWETALVSTMPLPRVAATSVEISAPTTFATAAMPSATPGRSARVEMEVAMAFAESWKPLVKSNRSAVATTTRSRVPVKHVSGRSGARKMAQSRHIRDDEPPRRRPQIRAATEVPAQARLMVFNTLMPLCRARRAPRFTKNARDVIPRTWVRAATAATATCAVERRLEGCRSDSGVSVPSPFDAEHLPQFGHDLHQVALLLHDLPDVLVGSGDLVEDAPVLPAFDEIPAAYKDIG